MLSIKDLTFRYSRKSPAVLDSLNLSLKDGETGVLLGKNGSGKTTLFKTILGFEKPESGQIEFNGKNLLKMSRRERAEQIAYVPQHSFSATLAWQNPGANLSLSADGQSHRWATNEHSQGTRIAGFVEFDVGAWRSFAWNRHKFTLRASVRNLLDMQYDIVAHYPMPGRSWRLQLTIE